MTENCCEAAKRPLRLLWLADGEADETAAQSLAERLGLCLVRELPEAGGAELLLRLDAEGLSLLGDGRQLRGDFAKLLPRIAPGRLPGELLVKAAKLKNSTGEKTAVDATAGLGEDAFLLAAAGFSVRLYERDAVIAALLRDALQRAAAVPALADAAGRMRLFEEDSTSALPLLETPPDVILLDPMFPARQKSALIKKKFQLLQQLERPCADENELLQAALAAGPRKVIVKRPLKGPYLADRKPDYSLCGKAIRYDCVVLPRPGKG